jgi:glycosyltransferase involved in cell wall biosynthesis
MPPTVVHVMGWQSQQYGSFERFLVALAQRGAAAGIAMHLVFRSPPSSAAFVADVPAEIHVVQASRAPLDPAFARALRGVLRSTRATHLHAHFGLDAMNALAVARASGVRRRFATKHITPGRSRRTGAALRHRWLAAQVEVFFAVSEQVRADLVALGVPDEKTVTSYLGVDPEVYAPSEAVRAEVRQELGVPDGRRLVVSSSHLRPGKGVELLPGLAAGLAARGIDAAVVVAGGGPVADSLSGDAAARGLGEEHFRLLGVREDIPRLLAAADAYVFAATGDEGLPLAPLEAAAAGAPVVATAVSDLPGLLGPVARIVPPGDAGALLDGVVAVLSDPALADLRERARARVVAHLNVRAGADLHVERYQAPR